MKGGLLFGLMGWLTAWMGRRVKDSATNLPFGEDAEPVLDARPRHGPQVRGLSMAFGGVKAVSGLNWGALTSLTGPNGVGKTTVLNMSAGERFAVVW
ncbi:hypothetical protein [Alcanivorax sp. 6-D-6]|uniref:hypothetical protein n=1 Tax=Alcanivorax xiamenensis TaxID=1177156 RepID=UPI001358F08F